MRGFYHAGLLSSVAGASSSKNTGLRNTTQMRGFRQKTGYVAKNCVPRLALASYFCDIDSDSRKYLGRSSPAMRENSSPLRILISFTLNICWRVPQLARGLFAACLSEPRLILYWKYRIYRESCLKDSVYLSSRVEFCV